MIEKKYKVTQRLKSRYLIVTARGFEPLTLRAEIWYSIQLNYAAFLVKYLYFMIVHALLQ